MRDAARKGQRAAAAPVEREFVLHLTEVRTYQVVVRATTDDEAKFRASVDRFALSNDMIGKERMISVIGIR